MRLFIAGMMSYHPGWLIFLYAVRWGFVRLLGMKQEGVPEERPFHHIVVRQMMQAGARYELRIT
ncbi:MAG: DUF2867 domain-containing protein [Chloroflexi bacterium]|nr:MAG: DUF2867 domain-containing protein [Chloroflexota bacterium]